MARSIRSVYIHAPAKEAHAAWKRFVRQRGLARSNANEEEAEADQVQFIPAEGGCVMAVVLDGPALPGPLGRIFSRPAWHLDNDLEGFKRLAEGASQLSF